MKKVYEVFKFTAQIPYSNAHKVEPLCTLEDNVGESLGKFDKEEAAWKELKKYNPDCVVFPDHSCVEVTEYVMEICTVDEDGEFYDGSDFDYKDWKFDTETNEIVILD